jgi:hypothetical protein
MRLTRILLFFSIFTQSLLAQNQNNSVLDNLAVGINYHQGYIVPNYPGVPKSKLPFYIELRASKQTIGAKPWQQLYKFPRVGFSVFYCELGNRKELGQSLGLVPNMTFNLQKTEKYHKGLTIGAGMAFFNKPYDTIDNPNNIYIGSKATAMVFADLYWQWKLTSFTSFNTGLFVSHCSNGHTQIPNVGINLMAIHAGVVFHGKGYYKKPEGKTLELPAKQLRYNLSFGIGSHQYAETTKPVNTSNYAIYLADISISKRFGKIHNVHTGIGTKYYNSYYTHMQWVKKDIPDRTKNAVVLTWFLADELRLNHFSLLAQGGINFYNPYYRSYFEYVPENSFSNFVETLISTKLGFQYYIFEAKNKKLPEVFIGVYIKGHFGQADFVCSQVGFSF